MIDLHTHSSASDGTYSPEKLVKMAAKTGISTMALTDHDTISGIDEAARTAKKLEINFIAGIEFNIEINFGELHLLAYGMDLQNKDFLDLIALCTKNRNERNLELCDMFNKGGIPISYNLMKSKFSGQIGRPHFAKMLKELKVVKSIREGFDKYLATGRPYFLKTKGLNFEKTLTIIKAAKGVPVLAHPFSLYLSWKNLVKKIQELQEQGLECIEAWNGGTKPGPCRRLEKLAKRLGLYVTAGSDFHGKNKTGHELGRKSDGSKIQDYFYTENLKVLLELSAK